MSRKQNRKGFTLAETLITVAILAILAGLAVVGVIQYRKSLKRLELDTIAREIFVSAQNHLSMVEGQGFLEISNFGTEDSREKGRYYFLVNNGDAFNPASPSLLDLILPFGAVDETVRMGGNYIIYYQRSPALILDVFYTDEDGVFAAADFSQTSGLFAEYKGSNNRKRENYNNKVIGWYGREGEDNLQAGALLQAPTITVNNGEKLEVVISNIDSKIDNSTYLLQLIVRGLTSNKIRAISINNSEASSYTYKLDDISTANEHFAEKGDLSGFYPGENISLQAKVFSKSVLTNVAASELAITNSLFDTDTTVDTSGNAVAVISNFRHLENLSKAISNCTAQPSNPVFQVTKAVQTADLSWDASSFKTSGIIPYKSNSNSKKYFPVTTDKPLSYDGRYHSITGIVANDEGNAGMFGTLTDSSVSNLKLIDFSITGPNAGALAGSFASGTVSNVVAYNLHDSEAAFAASGSQNISGTASAGGLIGSMSGGTVEKSAAALIVRSSGRNGHAGGLIGTVTGNTSSITASYSGGHTVSGTAAYDPDNFNVTADSSSGIAGGLVGSFSGSGITNSYSTCSVSGATAGGFVGKALSGTLTKCYCTGLVSGTTEGAFAGELSGTASGCKYYGIINERFDDATNQFVYLSALGGNTSNANIVEFDSSTADYNAFIPSASADAVVYDDQLTEYYGTGSGAARQSKYFLPTVAQLAAATDYTAYYVNTHYGDWPAPEVFIINSNS